MIWFPVHLNLSKVFKKPLIFPPMKTFFPNTETWQICNRMTELCWMCTEFIAGRGTSKLPELGKVAQACKPCHFTEILYDHQANSHNLDAASAENTEWHDQKNPSEPMNKKTLTDICLCWQLMKTKFYSKTYRARSCQKIFKNHKNMSFLEKQCKSSHQSDTKIDPIPSAYIYLENGSEDKIHGVIFQMSSVCFHQEFQQHFIVEFLQQSLTCHINNSDFRYSTEKYMKWMKRKIKNKKKPSSMNKLEIIWNWHTSTKLYPFCVQLKLVWNRSM